MKQIRWGWLAVAAVPSVFIGYFYIYPVARILLLGLSELDIGASGVQARLFKVGWFTLWQASLSTVLTSTSIPVSRRFEADRPRLLRVGSRGNRRL